MHRQTQETSICASRYNAWPAKFEYMSASGPILEAPSAQQNHVCTRIRIMSRDSSAAFEAPEPARAQRASTLTYEPDLQSRQISEIERTSNPGSQCQALGKACSANYGPARMTQCSSGQTRIGAQEMGAQWPGAEPMVWLPEASTVALRSAQKRTPPQRIGQAFADRLVANSDSAESVFFASSRLRPINTRSRHR